MSDDPERHLAEQAAFQSLVDEDIRRAHLKPGIWRFSSGREVAFKDLHPTAIRAIIRKWNAGGYPSWMRSQVHQLISETNTLNEEPSIEDH